MNRILKDLQPESVFRYFEEICNIPHVSYHTEAITQYVIAFAKNHNLRFYSDAVGNVAIYKSASSGYEDHQTVILQGHIDMVGAKKPGSLHDFEKDAIRLNPETISEGYISAIDTTLGGDDGIAVAYMLAILENDELKHPALECVFTVNEEVGLLGAEALDMSVLSGKTMINMDTENEGFFVMGSAGGAHMDCRIPVHSVKALPYKASLKISGLVGGHSGIGIGSGRPSAIVLMGRLLDAIADHMDSEIQIGHLHAGEIDNAIAVEAEAELYFDKKEDFSHMKEICKNMLETFRLEYRGIDDGISIEVYEADVNSENGSNQVAGHEMTGDEPAENVRTMACDRESTANIIFFLMNAPYGVQQRNSENVSLVETSLNPGVVRLTDTEFKTEYLVRSSFAGAKKCLLRKLSLLTERLGGSTELSGEYGGWAFNPKSHIRTLVKEVYTDLYGKEPVFEIIHAGLECGAFYDSIPNLDIISYGPNLSDVHTYHERMEIASAARVYEMTVRLLERL